MFCFCFMCSNQRCRSCEDRPAFAPLFTNFYVKCHPLQLSKMQILPVMALCENMLPHFFMLSISLTIAIQEYYHICKDNSWLYIKIVYYFHADNLLTKYFFYRGRRNRGHRGHVFPLLHKFVCIVPLFSLYSTLFCM